MADDATMEVESVVGITENPTPVDDSDKGVSKRTREDGEESEEKGEKKAKIEDAKSVEEQKNGVEEEEEQKSGIEEDGKESGTATVGPKTFDSSVQMFDYFFKLLHNWSPNLNLNKVTGCYTVFSNLLKGWFSKY